MLTSVKTQRDSLIPKVGKGYKDKGLEAATSSDYYVGFVG